MINEFFFFFFFGARGSATGKKGSISENTGEKDLRIKTRKERF